MVTIDSEGMTGDYMFFRNGKPVSVTSDTIGILLKYRLTLMDPASFRMEYSDGNISVEKDEESHCSLIKRYPHLDGVDVKYIGEISSSSNLSPKLDIIKLVLNAHEAYYNMLMRGDYSEHDEILHQTIIKEAFSLAKEFSVELPKMDSYDEFFYKKQLYRNIVK